MDYSKLTQAQLSRNIALQRERMKRTYEKYQSFTHPKVIEESQKLDVMIVYYQRFYGS